MTSEEIHRRSQFPEQMAISLLQQYIHKTKDKLDLEKECEMDGIILQRGNRTQVKSCFSLLIEGVYMLFTRICTREKCLVSAHEDWYYTVRIIVNLVTVHRIYDSI